MEIIMETTDQKKHVKSIEEVQKAESGAQLVIEGARKRGETRLGAAEERARGIVDEAESEAISMSETILKKADAELDKLRKKRLEEAHKAADKIRRAKLGKRRMERLADDAVRKIIGA